MALLTSELRRLRYELGYNVLNVGASPYVGTTALFEQVVAEFLQAGATTTSSTTVAAASPIGSHASATLTLDSATGFSQFDRVVVDVDSRQELATVSSVSGSTIVVLLSLAHSGSYPVTVDGGESMVRDLLQKLVGVADRLNEGSKYAGVKQVDEIHFFGGNAATRVEELMRLREYYRQELADLLGVPNQRAATRQSSGRIALY